MTIDELLSGVMPERDTTYDRAVGFLKKEPADGEKPAAYGYRIPARFVHISAQTSKVVFIIRSRIFSSIYSPIMPLSIADSKISSSP
ncbi:MAG: hypothetical protein LBL96_06485 [Clostridiales bacterium]|jgi:hypothetical protein|nr:hypothetical protein [Clostridiales bacterium]